MGRDLMAVEGGEPNGCCWILARAYVSRRGRRGWWRRTAGAHCRCGQPCRVPSASAPVAGRLNGNGREFEDFLVLQIGVGSAVSASLARQIENAVDCPDRVEGAGVAALERHLARPVVVDPVRQTRGRRVEPLRLASDCQRRRTLLRDADPPHNPPRRYTQPADGFLL